MHRRIFRHNKVIYYDTKKAKLIAKQFSYETWGSGVVYSYITKFLYLTKHGNWFFYENEIYPHSDPSDEMGVRRIKPCDRFKALEFMAKSGRMDLAKKYGIVEEDA